jgi:hypothetical protein
MARERMTISWDELNSDKVEKKLQQQQAIADARDHYDRAQVPVAPARKPRFQFIYNTLFYMTVFGAIGGLLGWTFGILLHLRPNNKLLARDYIAQYQDIQRDFEAGKLEEKEMGQAIRSLKREAGENPYFAIFTDTTLSPRERESEIRQVDSNESWKNFIANLLFYGVGGLFIGASLSLAEPFVERNWAGATINGTVGAAIGLIGGVAVALFIDRIYRLVAGNEVGEVSHAQNMIAHAVQWGVLGLFLSLGPGLMLRNAKRLVIGLIGGCIGGVIGGLLFVPLEQFGKQTLLLEYSDLLSRLVGLVAIGLIAGLGTGLIENIAKNGWMKVIDGLIAGKQFILYRNPTYIGSSPQCHIYLFKDPQVGRRHAAIHITPAGFEIEDLPLGSPTFVNGKPVTRTKLKTNDQIQIGASVFNFQEKPKPSL